MGNPRLDSCLSPIPFLGIYSASKFALEGYAEALRHEVKPFNIHVSLTEAGFLKTPMMNNRQVGANRIGEYDPWRQRALDAIRASEEQGPGPEQVAETLLEIISSNDEGVGIERRRTMRVMVIVKASRESEAGQMPSEQLLADMGNFNEELVKAGVMLAGDGLHPSSKGKRVKFSGAQRTVIDGPFAETKELVAGYWLWQVISMDDAVEWLKKAPFDGGTEVEIRQVFEADDFGKEFTPELRAQDERLRAQIGAR